MGFNTVAVLLNDFTHELERDGRYGARIAEAMRNVGHRREGLSASFGAGTWATWMRRYGKLDTYDLVDTGRWKDPASARRYAHTEPTETARLADRLPVEKRRRK